MTFITGLLVVIIVLLVYIAGQPARERRRKEAEEAYKQQEVAHRARREAEEEEQRNRARREQDARESENPVDWARQAYNDHIGEVYGLELPELVVSWRQQCRRASETRDENGSYPIEYYWTTRVDIERCHNRSRNAGRATFRARECEDSVATGETTPYMLVKWRAVLDTVRPQDDIAKLLGVDFTDQRIFMTEWRETFAELPLTTDEAVRVLRNHFKALIVSESFAPDAIPKDVIQAREAERAIAVEEARAAEVIRNARAAVEEPRRAARQNQMSTTGAVVAGVGLVVVILLLVGLSVDRSSKPKHVVDRSSKPKHVVCFAPGETSVARIFNGKCPPGWRQQS